MLFLSNAFNDPKDPWYYVLGVLFLLLVFGALAVYIILTGKKKKNVNRRPEDEQLKEEVETPEPDIAADADSDTDAIAERVNNTDE